MKRWIKWTLWFHLSGLVFPFVGITMSILEDDLPTAALLLMIGVVVMAGLSFWYCSRIQNLS